MFQGKNSGESHRNRTDGGTEEGLKSGGHKMSAHVCTALAAPHPKVKPLVPYFPSAKQGEKPGGDFTCSGRAEDSCYQMSLPVVHLPNVQGQWEGGFGRSRQ